ncbi:MAG TPA: hypothetical protein GX527_05840, partial [Clostridiaceae bacterium]|nr:hypothetical protein [Clostridiaceae bacterium]
AIKRKKEIIARKEGPVLLDTLTYRFTGHSPSDASSYRSKIYMSMYPKAQDLLFLQ